MLTEVYDLYAEGSISAKLRTYIQDDSKDLMIRKRPMMIICPGGGYNHLSDRESEPLAILFVEKL